MKVTIKNHSKRAIPQELLDTVSFTRVNEANEIAAEYNLKIKEFTQEYDGTEIVEQIIVIGDAK